MPNVSAGAGLLGVAETQAAFATCPGPMLKPWSYAGEQAADSLEVCGLAAIFDDLGPRFDGHAGTQLASGHS